jgi:hypothetical protein
MQYEYLIQLTNSPFAHQYAKYEKSEPRSVGSVLKCMKPDGTSYNIYGPTMLCYGINDTLFYTRHVVNYRPHNERKSAVVHYRSDGTISRKSYYDNGKLHNAYGPAVTAYYPNGTISKIEYYVDGLQCNKHGPKSIHYYPNGKIKCEEY